MGGNHKNRYSVNPGRYKKYVWFLLEYIHELQRYEVSNYYVLVNSPCSSEKKLYQSARHSSNKVVGRFDVLKQWSGLNGKITTAALGQKFFPL
jgi:hypothetical protein